MTDKEMNKRLETIEILLRQILELIMEDFDPDEEEEEQVLMETVLKRRDWERWVQ